MESGLNYADIKQTLTNDLTNLDMYFQQWRLRLNVEKTVSSCFHHTNYMAKRHMEVSCGGNTIPTTPTPSTSEVTLDRSLTYAKHLAQLSMKVNARCNLLRRLAGTKWGAHFGVLQTSTTALAFAPAEYCSPVWCRSAHTHRLDAALNNGLRLVSGSIRSTPTFMLPVVSGIMPPDIRRNKHCLALSRRAEADDQHALHSIVTASTPVRKRLHSHHPFSEHAKQLTSDAHGKTNRAWAEGTREMIWDITRCRLKTFVHTPSNIPIGHDLTRQSLVRLNRIRTGYGRFKSNMNRMWLSPAASCECGATDQTAQHIASECPLHTCDGDLVVLDTAARNWLHDLECVVYI